MDAFDDMLFTYALRDAFEGLYIRENDHAAGHPEIPTLAHSWGDCMIYIPLAAGAGEVAPSVHSPLECRFSYTRSFWYYEGWVASRWPFDPPFLENGDLYPQDNRSDPATLAVIKAVWNVFLAVTTNRVRLMYPQPDGRPWREQSRRWCGHHALLWCRNHPGHVIGGRLQPLDEWQVPEDPWFQGLWQRVVRDYGEDFADPDSGSPLVSLVPRGMAPNAPR